MIKLSQQMKDELNSKGWKILALEAMAIPFVMGIGYFALLLINAYFQSSL